MSRHFTTRNLDCPRDSSVLICAKSDGRTRGSRAENSKSIMGKRSKELRKRKREQAQRLSSSVLDSNTSSISCQPLINVLVSIKAPQSAGTAFYHDDLKGFRKSIRGLLDKMVKMYEEKSPTTKKQRKEQMKRYNARRDQAEHATVDSKKMPRIMWHGCLYLRRTTPSRN